MRHVICLGDSNTVGYNPQDPFGTPYERPWPAVLGELTGWDVLNFSHNGEEIPTGDFRLELKRKRIEKHLPADVLLVMYGTNDILNAAVPSLDLIKQRMERFVCFLKEHFAQSRIVLCTPVYITCEDFWKQQVCKEMNHVLAGLAVRYGVEHIDSNEIKPELTFDGIHFSQRDHVRLGEYMKEKLK